MDEKEMSRTRSHRYEQTQLEFRCVFITKVSELIFHLLHLTTKQRVKAIEHRRRLLSAIKPLR